MKDIKITVIDTYDTEGHEALYVEKNWNGIFITQGKKDTIYLQEKELDKLIEALQSLKS